MSVQSYNHPITNNMFKFVITKLTPALVAIVLLGNGCVLNREANVAKTDVKLPSPVLQKDKDGRMILSVENYSDRTDVCKQEFSADAPSTKVDFSNKEWGISLQAPYNPK